MAKEKEELTYREKLGHTKYIDPGIDCSKDEKITKQEGKTECDINNILRKHVNGISIDRGNPLPATFGDFSKLPDYQTSQNMIIEAEEAFMEQPATLRKRFNNDPAEMIAFVQNDQNYDEAYQMGLIPQEQYEKRKPKAEPKTEPKQTP